MSVEPRWIEIKGENQHQVVVGYQLFHLAEQCKFTAEELANKARVGVGYVRRIFNGLAPLMQEYQIHRLCQAMDISMSDFYKAVEKTNFDHLRAVLRTKKRIVAAGGARRRKFKLVKGGK